MRDHTTTPCVLFPDLFDRPLTATFDVPNASYCMRGEAENRI